MSEREPKLYPEMETEIDSELEAEPKLDSALEVIHYSEWGEMPRATFAFPEKFTEESYRYEDVFINELLIEHQPYELNVNSPTPLDPFHLKVNRAGYYTSAEVYMENRLMVASDAIGLAEHHSDIIRNEIHHEHFLRSNRNNEAIRHIRMSVDSTQPVDPVTAQLVLKARAGMLTLEEAAYLLAAFPPSVDEEDYGIEFIKYTGPLMDLVEEPVGPVERNGNRAVALTRFDVAHHKFLNALDSINQSSSGVYIDASTAQPQRPRKSDGSGIDNILTTKGKDADVYVYGSKSEPVHIEAVGRYSYYVPGVTDQALKKVRPTVAKINGKPVAMYDIALSKYVRIARPDRDNRAA
ncbi:MAG: hypothetical protein JWM07_501 [Candidatus Saccharibacteria bacterium]|jgi:hypothetical protein|nr:hypothetical protein [Candidatus Saccharibacteria bacterium]